MFEDMSEFLEVFKIFNFLEHKSIYDNLDIAIRINTIDNI